MRLDLYLLENQMVKSRSQATDLIKRGLIMVDEVVVTKPGHIIKDQTVKIVEEPKFASRAGEKLLQAIFDFNIDLNGKTVIDIGSSTGGFTDCALQHGAKEIYAYDVGKDQMIEPLRSDIRVHLFEGTNILDVNLPDSDVILIDVSFTSIKPILKHLIGFKGYIVALIKPQFEVGNIHFKQGVLKDMKLHKKILNDVLLETITLGFAIIGLKKSGLKGKAGNQEYILYIGQNDKLVDIKKTVEDALC